MNKELALEQIDACILMLEQIKSSITGAGDSTPKQFWVDSDGVQHFEKDPYLLDGDIFCCGERCRVDNDKYICQVCGSKYRCEQRWFYQEANKCFNNTTSDALFGSANRQIKFNTKS